MARRKDGKEWVFIARVEWDMTGDLHLHVLEDQTTAELHPGDEFFTVSFAVDPFADRPS